MKRSRRILLVSSRDIAGQLLLRFQPECEDSVDAPLVDMRPALVESKLEVPVSDSEQISNSRTNSLARCQSGARMDEPEEPAMRTIDELPPLLTVKQAAQLLQLKVSTVYRHVSEGRYRKAVRRGKPLRFDRDKLISEFMR